MAIPSLTRQNIIDAFKEIDKTKTPRRKESKTYYVLSDDRKPYSVKYVVETALKLKNSPDYDVPYFNSNTAVRFLKKLHFEIIEKNIEAGTIITTDTGVSYMLSSPLDIKDVGKILVLNKPIKENIDEHGFIIGACESMLNYINNLILS